MPSYSASQDGFDGQVKTMNFLRNIIHNWFYYSTSSGEYLYKKHLIITVMLALFIVAALVIHCTVGLPKFARWHFYTYKRKAKTDKILVGSCVVLLIIGLIALYSVSAYSELSNGSTDIFNTFTSQLVVVIVGLAAMFVISYLDTKWYKPLGYVTYAGVLVLLGAAAILGRINDQDFGRYMYGFQPSEIAKTALILLIAAVMETDFYRIGKLPVPKSKELFPRNTGVGKNDTFLRKRFAHIMTVLYEPGKEIYNKRRFPANPKADCVVSTVKCVAAVMLYGLLVILGNHISGMVLIVAIGLIPILLGNTTRGVKWGVFGVAFICAIVLILALVFHERLENIDLIGDLVTKIYERFNSDDNEQVQNAIIALGRGGIFGVGFGQSIMKKYYVPVAESDMIFSIICEEGGFITGVFIILLYALVIFRCLKIARRTNRLNERYVVYGVAGHIFVQALLHLIVNLNLLFNTGAVLPFISAGGSALFMQCIEIGMVLSVERHNNLREEGRDMTPVGAWKDRKSKGRYSRENTRPNPYSSRNGGRVR